ncbi:DNA fragmentation factor subunit alpha isoform X2 [Xenopus laevis]|uniref:DNAation factor subunit alpha isoform X2 n=1 Tax=Xenopus laevis TaxID=8355 RepID=A0A8J0TAM9_XENLA|nr:DNA fragmentation factor subunit alpha isoform X2 [Xenopus laevis]
MCLSLILAACKMLSLDSSVEPITLVLAEDGTIVEDEDYFLCIPPNTKFVVLTGNTKWAPTTLDGGIAWLAKDSMEVEDESVVDGADSARWKNLALQLKENLSNIILMSESELQILTEVSVDELAGVVGVSCEKVQSLQDTLQRVLDRREEERQSKQLLELYLKAVNKERTSEAETIELAEDEVDTGRNIQTHSDLNCKTLLSSHIIQILKEKDLPHLSLSNKELENVNEENTEALMMALGWNEEKIQVLKNSCHQELKRRDEQVQSLNSLTNLSHINKKPALKVANEKS